MKTIEKNKILVQYSPRRQSVGC